MDTQSPAAYICAQFCFFQDRRLIKGNLNYSPFLGGRGTKFTDIFELTVANDELASNMAASAMLLPKVDGCMGASAATKCSKVTVK